ncbi:hypothetical protein HYFRA_00009316 [Hymenoscyphus fraxineus]|uniref:Uncharacterized protein n=1 Tax=Hymenoscyphus fraxineus TaxID=746836 RepID=A0A9N9KZ42_9HELO|nr:hypothetical protein HYFRA_00009316 [Hymenoscyphus fraxineus]
MFLLSSAASLHGHEFSPHVEHNPTQRRNTLARSAFSKPTIPRRNTTYETTTRRIRPVLSRPLSEYTPTASEPVVHFEEPELEAMSEDGRSMANSEGTTSTVDIRKHRRRSIRTSTAFSIAHPAPTLTQKQRLLQIRPRLLLQLQLLSAAARPKPAIDVVPSTLVLPPLIEKCPRMFRGKGELGANDVMVLKSEDYDTEDGQYFEETDSDDESLGNRHLMAVICPLRKDCGGASGKTEIVMNDGAVWVATPLNNNLYEFVKTDGDGNITTARWVKKNAMRKSVDFSEGTTNINNDFRFTFSVINPATRRHPIMATLTPNKLDIPDHYVSVSSSSAIYPPTALNNIHPSDTANLNSDQTVSLERNTVPVDENLKSLIQVTSIWVALRQGLSPYFKYSDSMAATVSNPSHGRAASMCRVRSASLTPGTPRHSSAMSISSTPESNAGSLGVLGDKIRRSVVRGSPVCSSFHSDVEFATKTTPKRAVSTGSVFMRREAARKAMGTVVSTRASDSEGEVTFQAAKRRATEALVTDLPTPSGPLTLSGSATSTPYSTPTKPQRRVQSAHIPTSALQHSFINGNANGHKGHNSLDVMQDTKAPYLNPKPKSGKWKAFTNFFRRSHSRVA